MQRGRRGRRRLRCGSVLEEETLPPPDDPRELVQDADVEGQLVDLVDPLVDSVCGLAFGSAGRSFAQAEASAKLDVPGAGEPSFLPPTRRASVLSP